MGDQLAKSRRIEIRGFGSIGINARPTRIGRNTKTGESVNVAAKHVPHFKPGLELKRRLINLSCTLQPDVAACQSPSNLIITQSQVSIWVTLP